MARQRIEIKRIDKRSARQVTYSKRRKGLIKKAQELSILCDAEVALMVFSSTGKFTHYASSDLDLIIEKYLQKMDDEDNPQSFADLLEEKNTYERLSKEVEEAEIILRQMQGENLESLSLKELDKLEKSLSTGLDLIHKRKEMSLTEENAQLREQVNMLMDRKGSTTIISEEEIRRSFESTNNNNASTSANYIEYPDIDTTLRLGLPMADWNDDFKVST